VRLFVGAESGVHEFDLMSGQRREFRVDAQVTGLALSRRRLFAVTNYTLTEFDTRTGAKTVRIDGPGKDVAYRSGESGAAPRPMDYAVQCVFDEKAGALLFCEHITNNIHRFCGL
jgi:hypothetical protein